MNNPFDYVPDVACREAYERLLRQIEELKESERPEDMQLCKELAEGKMLGVMVARDREGNNKTLYAFSGQIGEYGFHHRAFVGPVFDYLEPDGYFKTKEKEIDQLNEQIRSFQVNQYNSVYRDYSQAKEKADKEITAFQKKCRRSKEQRRLKRLTEAVTDDELNMMVRQSQFEKAELKRVRQRWTDWLKPYQERINEVRSQMDELKTRRREKSENLQQWLFDNFRLLNGCGEWESLSEIFSKTPMKVPPSGAGECCAPKLLQEVYSKGWQPLAIAEFWYGKPKDGELRIEGQHYPACRGKCLPIMRWMLEGLNLDKPLDSSQPKEFEPEILFVNDWFCVVDKPSGMLSVPGKDSEVSLQDWLIKKYGPERNVKVAHRLDQDTSGIIIATFGDGPFKIMQSLFATRRIRKTYIAELEGDYISLSLPVKGRIELPLAPDYLDRPRQRIDFVFGKEAVTEYSFIRISDGRTRVQFSPRTGRTHQLRVHAAADAGLGMPIVGDRLYGVKNDKNYSRLLLHAHKLSFIFPIDGLTYNFESPVPF